MKHVICFVALMGAAFSLPSYAERTSLSCGDYDVTLDGTFAPAPAFLTVSSRNGVDFHSGAATVVRSNWYFSYVLSTSTKEFSVATSLTPNLPPNPYVL